MDKPKPPKKPIKEPPKRPDIPRDPTTPPFIDDPKPSKPKTYT